MTSVVPAEAETREQPEAGRTKEQFVAPSSIVTVPVGVVDDPTACTTACTWYDWPEIEGSLVTLVISTLDVGRATTVCTTVGDEIASYRPSPPYDAFTDRDPVCALGTRQEVLGNTNVHELKPCVMLTVPVGAPAVGRNGCTIAVAKYDWNVADGSGVR